MMKNHQQLSILLILSLSILLNSGCKTQADIQRERTVENLNQQVVQSQKSNVSVNMKIQNLEEQIQKLTGMIEDSNFTVTSLKKENSSLKDKLQNIEESQRALNDANKLLNDKLNQQTQYLENVLSTLNQLTQDSDQKKQKKKSDSNELNSKRLIPEAVDLNQKNSQDNHSEDEDADELKISTENGIAKFKANKISESKTIFLKILENKNSKKSAKESALYYLGQIEYKNKNFEDAKIYFSRLFAEYGQSKLLPSTLLLLAKTFLELKEKTEAELTINELKNRFPNSKEYKSASKLKIK